MKDVLVWDRAPSPVYRAIAESDFRENHRGAVWGATSERLVKQKTRSHGQQQHYRPRQLTPPPDQSRQA